MRKIFTFIAGSLITGSLIAGGLVTNTNQSAAWVRLPSRNASTEVDAAYFNPAGLMKLENGFHFSLSNQTIFQKRKIENSYAGPGGAYGLNEHLYKGNVTAPIFPSVYAVYKLDKFAFSLGFMPIGGGGGATYDKGLPSFEMGIADLVPGLYSQGINATEYNLDVFFEGSSIFFGYQGGLSYKVNDWLSVAAGARYVTAKNTYTGHLQDIQINIGGTWTKAFEYFNTLVTNLTGIIGIPSSLAGAIGAGYGSATLQNLVDANQMTTTQKAGIEAGLVAIGVPSAALPTMNLNTISGTVTAATPTLSAKRASAAGTATLVSDKTADATQTGSGIAPFFDVNISPTENLNIGIKFEMATKLELTNSTKQDLLVGYTLKGDSITQFPDGEKIRNDMPAMLAIGVDYKISSKLKVALGGNYYFDKLADFGHNTKGLLPSTTPEHTDNIYIIKNNGLAIHGGIEYNVSDKLLVSGGYAWANQGVNSNYQSDLTHGLASSTIGAGAAYSINDKIKVNLGAGYTMYTDDSIDMDHYLSGTYTKIAATETYSRTTFIIGVGLDVKF
jgi:long-chain fatty acid transport protein